MNLQKNKRTHLEFSCIFLIGVLFWNTLPAKAQLDAQISQHMFNRTHYNPAATGASAYVNAFLLARLQWVDWEGAPKTQIAAVHSYFPSIRSGLGLNFINDKLGFERIQTVNVLYAYHLVINPDSYLSMGLGAGIQYQSVDYTKQNAVNSTDPNLFWDNTHKVNPDFAFGLEYNQKRLRIGFSTTHLTRRPKYDTPLSTGMHFQGYARYDIPVGFNWTLSPSFFAQHSIKSTHLEIGTLAFYRRLFWIGAFFRTDEKVDPESCVFMAGVNITQYVRIGYAFDFNINYLRGYTQNSHELFISLQLPHRVNMHDKTPRFFE